MDEGTRISDTGMDVVDGCLVVPIGGNMDYEAIGRLGRDICTRISATPAKGVIINVTAIKVMDSYVFSIFRNTARTIHILGVRTVFVGFQPGVVSSLVDLDMEFYDILTAVTTEDALDILRHPTSGQNQADAGYNDSPEGHGHTGALENG